MEILEVEKILNGTKYEPFIGSIHKISFKDHVYNDLFRIGNEYLGYFALKIRKKDTNNFELHKPPTMSVRIEKAMPCPA